MEEEVLVPSFYLVLRDVFPLLPSLSLPTIKSPLAPARAGWEPSCHFLGRLLQFPHLRMGLSNNSPSWVVVAFQGCHSW